MQRVELMPRFEAFITLFRSFFAAVLVDDRFAHIHAQIVLKHLHDLVFDDHSDTFANLSSVNSISGRAKNIESPLGSPPNDR